MIAEDREPQFVDAERLVTELQQRVAAREAGRGYDEHLLDTPFELMTSSAEGVVVLHPEAAYSSKPVVGPIVTGVKRVLIKLLFHFLDDAVTQTNVALAATRAAVDREVDRRDALEAQLRRTSADLEDALRRIETLEAASRRGEER